MSAVLNFGARIGAASLHKLIAALAQRTRVRVSDVTVRYSQDGAPGPRPGLEGRLAGCDAAQLTIRTLRLEPAGTAESGDPTCAGRIISLAMPRL